MNPEQVLGQDALARPLRTYVSGIDREDEQVAILSGTLKDLMKKEPLTPEK